MKNLLYGMTYSELNTIVESQKRVKNKVFILKLSRLFNVMYNSKMYDPLMVIRLNTLK